MVWRRGSGQVTGARRVEVARDSDRYNIFPLLRCSEGRNGLTKKKS